MLMGISYRQSIRCPECKQQTPVNHLRTTMLCSHCQATTDLLQRNLAWWTDQLSCQLGTRMVFRVPEAKVGEINSSSNDIEFFRGPADCPTCHQLMTPTALVEGAASGTYTCACGFTCSCRDAEPSLVPNFRYARWLLGEAPAGGAAPQGTHAMVMACMSCGASLKVDGSSRTVDCTYCNTSNFLPDGVWLRMHPAPRLEWFRLVIDIDDASLADELRRPLGL
jgi:hypothetical protein